MSYATIVTENAGSNLRHVANRHEFVTWTGAGQVGAPLSNVFSSNNYTSAMKVEGGKAYLNGPLYDYSSNSLWIPGSTVSWQSALTQSVINVPTGGVFTYSSSNALFRYAGTEVVYNVNVSGTVTTQPTAGAAADYTLTVPQPVNTATYTAGTIIGELWLLVTNASSSNTFKAFARANANANVATLRVLSGTTEQSLSAIVAGNSINLQGTLTYTTPLINNANGLPVTYTPAAFVQDQLGAVSLGSGQAPRAEFDVVGTRSGLPALVVDQQASSGDIVQVRDVGVTKVVVDNNGNVGIGTTLPQGALHVQGSILTSGVLFANAGLYAPGTIIQVQQFTKTDTMNAAYATTWTNLSDLSVNITPKYATSKILVTYNLNVGGTGHIMFRLTRNDIPIGVGNASGNTYQSTSFIAIASGYPGGTFPFPISTEYIDTPNTSSSLTYKIQFRSGDGQTSYVITVNKGYSETDTGYYSRTISTITVKELAT
jgi:hypothetical protein